MLLLLKVSILLSFLFLLSELILLMAKHSSKRTAARQKDQGSLILLWLIIAISMAAGFNLARYRGWHLINYIIASAGILMILAGLIIRWIAILQLNKAFTVNVAIINDHELKTDGLYRIVRHPSYLGALLIMTGEALTMNTLLSFIIIFLPTSFAILYRIRVEEKLLEENFGDLYRQYSQKTPAIIPFIY